MEKIIDGRDGLNPNLLSMTKRSLAELMEDETLAVLVRDEATATAVAKLGKAMDFKTSKQSRGQDYRVSFFSQESYLFTNLEGSQIDSSLKDELVVMISSVGFGHGELGEVLMEQFLASLKALKDLPRAIIFYNAGVLLLKQDTKIYKILSYLREMGVAICGCTTSLEHYGIVMPQRGKLVYRRIDMLEMVSYMAGKYKILNI